MISEEVRRAKVQTGFDIAYSLMKREREREEKKNVSFVWEVHSSQPKKALCDLKRIQSDTDISFRSLYGTLSPKHLLLESPSDNITALGEWRWESKWRHRKSHIDKHIHWWRIHFVPHIIMLEFLYFYTQPMWMFVQKLIVKGWNSLTSRISRKKKNIILVQRQSQVLFDIRVHSGWHVLCGGSDIRATHKWMKNTITKVASNPFICFFPKDWNEKICDSFGFSILFNGKVNFTRERWVQCSSR